MELVIQSLQADWEAFLAFAPRFFYGLILLVVFLAVAKLVGKLAGRVLHRTVKFRASARFLQNVITWLISSVGILLALGLMGFQGIAASLLATGGVVAIVLGFAFREIGENFLAGFFLTFSRPFELGDLIETGDLTGVVRS
ncbi:MAG: mechanosensitive ion channel, partial [Alphaproteobacteria bacterium]|nr:mechanosensitive ion channel [Alphaproteobacteria bacterium]